MSAEKNGSLDQVKDLQSQFMAIGFVPKRAVNSLKSRFSEALNKAIAALPDLGAEEKDQAAFEVRLTNIKQGPQADKKIHHKEHHLRKQIAKAENDIATLRNNLEFFGRSKNAEKMKEEFNAKIKQADEEIVHLKKQLQMIQASA
jgi:predicted RNase H-like nuclease (RuvC/YqgF family)